MPSGPVRRTRCLSNPSLDNRLDMETMPGEPSEHFCDRGIHHWVPEILSNLTPFGTAEGREEPKGYFVNIGKKKTYRSCRAVAVTTMVKG